MDTTDGRLAARVAGLEYSAIRRMFQRAGALEAEGRDLAHLEIGEPDFGTPAHVIEGAFEAARGGATNYTAAAGIRELREAIADRPGGSGEFDPDSEIAVTTGGMEALYAAVQAVVDPGEEVVVPTPTWPNYLTQIRLAGGRPVEVPLPAAEGFDLAPGRVVDAVGENTAAVVFSSPSNPTGRVFAPEDVRAVVEAAAAHDCFVVADEVYDSLVYGDRPAGVPGCTDHAEHLLTVNSCSKRYAMTGWRLGWLAGPADVIDATSRLRGVMTASPSSVSQHAALAALTGPQDRAAEMAAAFGERRDHVVERLSEMPAVSAPPPEGGMYAFVDVSALPGTSEAIAGRLLEEYGVVTAPGDGFGDAGEGYLRLSFANSRERIDVGLDRLERMIREELSP
jgi:aspartate aminotransferase